MTATELSVESSSTMSVSRPFIPPMFCAATDSRVCLMKELQLKQGMIRLMIGGCWSGMAVVMVTDRHSYGTYGVQEGVRKAFAF